MVAQSRNLAFLRYRVVGFGKGLQHDDDEHTRARAEPEAAAAQPTKFWKAWFSKSLNILDLAK